MLPAATAVQRPVTVIEYAVSEVAILAGSSEAVARFGGIATVIDFDQVFGCRDVMVEPCELTRMHHGEVLPDLQSVSSVPVRDPFFHCEGHSSA